MRKPGNNCAGAFVILLVGLWLSGCGRPAAVSERELAMEQMARYLVTEVHPKNVLIISNPYTQQSGRPAEVYEFERASIAGLKRGFGTTAAITVGFPELKKEALSNPGAVQIDPKSSTPLSFLIANDAFQKLLQAQSAVDLVISVIGVPLDLNDLPAWTKSGAPRFALLQPDWRMIGRSSEIAAAFQSGKLAAALVRGSSPGESFVLVTATNASQLLQSRPELFFQ